MFSVESRKSIEHAKMIFDALQQKLFWLNVFTQLKNTAPQQVQFYGKLSTINVFKLCKM